MPINEHCKMHDWVTPGYETLELSTQRLIAAALVRGISVEVLDDKTQWVRLRKGGKTEIIRQGNETSADSYITSLILGDKSIQKTLLAEQGVRIPTGGKYGSVADALADAFKYRAGRWVIKPTTANYGLGITMLPENASASQFESAVQAAFVHDDTILVETFLPGIECRFLVIGGKCRAVLHRRPANVVGDGDSSIAVLVNNKNDDPRRGSGYKTPLEKIQLGNTESQVLGEQGFDFDSIPTEGETVWLRNNSNISTGGDSLDYTEIVHPDYLTIAEKATAAIGAQISGVDMMMADHTAAPTDSNYGIIELNYNPVLYFHDFPYLGENRNVAPHVLDVLGF